VGVQFFLFFFNFEVGNMEGFTIGTSTTSTSRRMGKSSRLVIGRLLFKLHRRYVVQVCTGMAACSRRVGSFFFLIKKYKNSRSTAAVVEKHRK